MNSYNDVVDYIIQHIYDKFGYNTPIDIRYDDFDGFVEISFDHYNYMIYIENDKYKYILRFREKNYSIIIEGDNVFNIIDYIFEKRFGPPMNAI
ncbi:MAG TPA: hypothetical protein VLG50_05575 [Candidatus Saccharimonadales bacterium]|nr:hypothetical protein [Candidatus Saccharimonadales bacterium]